MKRFRGIGTAAIVLCFGTMSAVFAQHDGGKQDEKQGRPEQAQRGEQQRGQQQQREQRQSPPQQQQRTEQPRQPQQRAEQPRQQRTEQPRQQQQRQEQSRQQASPQQQQQRPQQNRQYAPPQRPAAQAQSWQQQKGWERQGGAWQGGNNWQQTRSRNWSSEHRTWAQRGGYGGYYIPQDRFNIYFGSQHFFRLGGRPLFYMGYPRFQYSGFSFLLLDPWPEYWSDNWYDADDVYIDYDYYDNGYYLYNRRYPQARLAITVVM